MLDYTKRAMNGMRRDEGETQRYVAAGATLRSVFGEFGIILGVDSFERVADAVDRFDAVLAALDLLAQVTDVSVDRAIDDVNAVSPHRFDQAIAREHVLFVAGEVEQELELDRRQVDRRLLV